MEELTDAEIAAHVFFSRLAQLEANAQAEGHSLIDLLQSGFRQTFGLTVSAEAPQAPDPAPEPAPETAPEPPPMPPAPDAPETSPEPTQTAPEAPADPIPADPAPTADPAPPSPVDPAPNGSDVNPPSDEAGSPAGSAGDPPGATSPELPAELWITRNPDGSFTVSAEASAGAVEYFRGDTVEVPAVETSDVSTGA